MMYDERLKSYEQAFQTLVMIAALGTFSIMYNKDNPARLGIRDTVPKDYRPNKEAILMTDERSYNSAPVVHIPRRRIGKGYLCDKFTDTQYTRRQQM